MLYVGMCAGFVRLKANQWEHWKCLYSWGKLQSYMDVWVGHKWISYKLQDWNIKGFSLPLVRLFVSGVDEWSFGTVASHTETQTISAF